MFLKFSSILIPIFYKVLYLTIVGSLVGILVYFIRSIFNQKISQKWKCILWFIVLVSLLVPIRFELKIDNKLMENEIISKAENIKNIPYEQIYTKNVLEFENRNISKIQEKQKSNSLENLEIKKEKLQTTPFKTMIPAYIWLLGVLTHLAILLQTTRKINKRIKKQIYENERINNILEEVKTQLKVTRKIKIVLQDYKKIPSIYGLFKPAILISENTLNEDDETIKYIFMHELSHYKRKDILLNYLLLVILSIYWFNPVVWFIYKKIRQDIELGADELVLENLNKQQKKQYGLVLINSLKKAEKNSFSSVLCISDDSKNMERRIHMIKTNKKSMILSAILVITIILLISGVVFTNITNKEASVEYKVSEELYANNSEETTYEKVWKEPLQFNSYEEYVAYNESQTNSEVNSELTDEEKSTIMTEEQAKEKIKEILEKLGYKNPYIGRPKIHKNYIETSQIIYEANIDNTIRINIDAKTGSLEWLSDNKANFSELKREEISEEKAREIATDLFEKTGFNSEYKLHKCKEGTYTSGQIYNKMWECSFNKISKEGVLNTYEYATIVFLVTDGNVYIHTIGKRNVMSNTWYNENKFIYDDNPVVINEEKAIEIAKEIDKKFEKNEITYTNTVLSTNPVNHYVWLMEKTGGEDGYGSVTVETGENSSISYPKYYYPQTIVRNSYCVCLAHQTENNFEGRAYYIDATTGEVIGGQGYYIPE